MATEVLWRIQKAYATAAQWAAFTEPPLAGETCYESNTGKQKTGNGIDLYPALPYDFIDYHFRGKYISEAALELAVPVGNDGDYAIVDPGGGTEAQFFIWDAAEGWITGGGAGAVISVFGRTGIVIAQSGDYAAFYQTLNANLTALAGIAIQNGDFFYVEGGTIVRKTTAEVRNLLKSGRLLSNPYVNAGNTGNTNENIIGTIILVPAGTIEANDGIRMWGKIASTAATSKTLRTYVNTVPDLTGSPIQILAYVTSNTLTVPFVRNFSQRNLVNSMSGLPIGSPGTVSDETSTAVPNANFSVDWLVDQYIIRTMQNVSGADTFTLLQHFIQLLKAP